VPNSTISPANIESSFRNISRRRKTIKLLEHSRIHVEGMILITEAMIREIMKG